ncbi:MAG TPA: alpha/beta hydrolase [Bacilli bacterium]|nr:alpha/beta hydrolase [Bacilli bacterium]
MEINNIKINYIDYGNKKGQALILLHGWGQNIEMMDMLGKPFEKDFRIINLDLPGFGGSEEPKEALTIGDYAKILNELLINLNISNPIIIGHSFGGRVGIKYASMFDTKKLILLSAPFRGKGKKSIKLSLLKSLKKIPVLNLLEGYAKNKIGSNDYKKASHIMKKVLVHTVNENLLEDAKKVKCPTIIIHGTNDAAAPFEDSKILEKEMKNVGLIVYENCTHYAYLERLNQTLAILDNFIRR